MNMKVLQVGFMLGLVWARVSSGSTLTTPGLLSAATSTPMCIAVNVRAERLAVTVELRDDTGALLGSTVCSSLAGGHTCVASAATHSGGVYCRITTPLAAAFEGLPERFAATMMMVDASGDVTSAVAGRVEDNR